MRYSVALCAIVLLLAGCVKLTANPPDYIVYNLNRGFAGHPASDFFTHFGYPVAGFDHKDGTREYRWTSVASKTDNSKDTLDTYTSPTGEYHFKDSYHGVTERQYCELRIYADISDNITSFAIAVDSTGRYSASRCSELFGKTYP